MTYIALLFGIFALLIIKTALWLKKNRFPILVGDKTFKEIVRDFPEENISKEIIFSERVKNRVVIVELIALESPKYINELKKKNKESGRRFLTATELVCLGLKYKNSKKLSSCFILASYPTFDLKVLCMQKNHSLSLYFDDIQNIHYHMNILSGYKFYMGVVTTRKGLWMRFLTALCRFIFFMEVIIKRKVLT